MWPKSVNGYKIYSLAVEESMRIADDTLSEKDRRRFFSHVTRACQGDLFDSLETVMRLMRKTATQTGLSTTVHVTKKVYETGPEATDEFRENLPLKFDSVLPKWNDTAIPQAGH